MSHPEKASEFLTGQEIEAILRIPDRRFRGLWGIVLSGLPSGTCTPGDDKKFESLK